MTNIEWADTTWNPIVGCSKASAGCKNCYAMEMASRLEAMGAAQYQGLTTKKYGKINWTGKVRLVESALNKPLHWRKPRRIFVNSMGDLFHPDVPWEWVDKVFEVMKQCPQHQFQFLTKHPDLMNDYMGKGEIPSNLWLGTSIESADHAEDRLERLCLINHPNLFVSFEPLIGSVGRLPNTYMKWIRWAIVGGESGNGARPMNSEWVQEIYDSCQESGTAFFFKQWGAYGEDSIKRSKKSNGRKWHGQTWDQMPSF